MAKRLTLCVLCACLACLVVPVLVGADEPTGEGRPARFFLARDIEDKALIFSRSFIGDSACILSFFSTDCEPCKKEMPELDALVKGRLGVRLLFIGIDPANDIRSLREFVRPLDLTARVLFDEKGRISTLYGVKAVPALFVVDSKLLVTYQAVGYREGSLAELSAALDSIPGGSAR
jgi:peroxiredoxin